MSSFCGFQVLTKTLSHSCAFFMVFSKNAGFCGGTYHFEKRVGGPLLAGKPISDRVESGGTCPTSSRKTFLPEFCLRLDCLICLLFIIILPNHVERNGFLITFLNLGDQFDLMLHCTSDCEW